MLMRGGDLGDLRILGLECADTKINTKGISMECYAFVSRARFYEFKKNTISTTESAKHSTQSNIISGIYTATKKKISSCTSWTYWI